MNYEQKYEQALETARKINSGEGVAAPKDWNALEVIFPELKKNEDERIKTNIIKLLRFVRDTHHQYFDECNEAIDWFEKQSDDITYLENNWIREELIHFLETCQDPRFVGNRKQDEWISWLEKQGEQKQVSITYEWIEDYWQHEKVNNPNSYDKGDEIQFDHDGFIRFCKKYCQKPTWSCKDESMFACLWGILNWVERSNHSLAKNMGEYVEWLQSLKQRLNGYE